MEKGKLYKNKFKDLVVLCIEINEVNFHGVVVRSKISEYEIGDLILWYNDSFIEYIGQLDLNNAFDR